MGAIASARVLIVEDDEAIAALVRRTLADAGIEADVAATGLDGLWLAREHAYGAICLDILLPGMNGYEVCRTLRTEEIHTPILMLTAKTGEYDEIDGLDLGADDYLRKPFSPSVLVARVRALLRRRDTAQVAPTLSRGLVGFDTSSRECRVDGDVVDLTPREATLLEAMLRADDAPLSRAELLSQVWGVEFEGDPNVVDVYIGYLRRKLGRDRIETVRGVGFRVAA
ncbi:MAG: response regulator transcription factor [Actinomycetota bacterium]